MWLNVFELVEVESHIVDIDDQIKKRVFCFDDKSGVHGAKVGTASEQLSGTLIKLIRFPPLTPQALQRLLQENKRS